jgi:hypothetical protein
MKSRRVGVQTWAEALLDGAVLAQVKKGVEQPVARISVLVERAQKGGCLVASAEPEALARAMVALFHGFVLQKLWDPALGTTPYLAVLDAIIDGLLASKAKR